MAPCNHELKRRYAILNNASETEGRLNPRRVDSQGGKGLGGRVIDKRAAAGPLVRQPRRRKERSAQPIYNPQAQPRKKNERTMSFLRAHLRRALFMCLRAPPGVSADPVAQAKEKAYLLRYAISISPKATPPFLISTPPRSTRGGSPDPGGPPASPRRAFRAAQTPRPPRSRGR